MALSKALRKMLSDLERAVRATEVYDSMAQRKRYCDIRERNLEMMTQVVIRRLARLESDASMWRAHLHATKLAAKKSRDRKLEDR